jgi:hypothetical protein
LVQTPADPVELLRQFAIAEKEIGDTLPESRLLFVVVQPYRRSRLAVNTDAIETALNRIIGDRCPRRNDEIGNC